MRSGRCVADSSHEKLRIEAGIILRCPICGDDDDDGDYCDLDSLRRHKRLHFPPPRFTSIPNPIYSVFAPVSGTPSAHQEWACAAGLAQDGGLGELRLGGSVRKQQGSGKAINRKALVDAHSEPRTSQEVLDTSGSSFNGPPGIGRDGGRSGLCDGERPARIGIRVFGHGQRRKRTPTRRVPPLREVSRTGGYAPETNAQAVARPCAHRRVSLPSLRRRGEPARTTNPHSWNPTPLGGASSSGLAPDRDLQRLVCLRPPLGGSLSSLGEQVEEHTVQEARRPYTPFPRPLVAAPAPGLDPNSDGDLLAPREQAHLRATSAGSDPTGAGSSRHQQHHPRRHRCSLGFDGDEERTSPGQNEREDVAGSPPEDLAHELVNYTVVADKVAFLVAASRCESDASAMRGAYCAMGASDYDIDTAMTREQFFACSPCGIETFSLQHTFNSTNTP